MCVSDKDGTILTFRQIVMIGQRTAVFDTMLDKVVLTVNINITSNFTLIANKIRLTIMLQTQRLCIRFSFLRVSQDGSTLLTTTRETL